MSDYELSIVVAAQGSADITERCLRSLSKQACPPELLEIFVVEGPPHESCKKLSSKYPSVKFMKAGSTAVPMLHGLGMTKSTAELISITESHCTFPPHWAANTISAAAQTSTASVLGGTVQAGSELDTLNSGLFLCDYAQFVPPLERQPSTDLPGNNIVFRRDSLDFTKNFAKNGFWKTFYCHDLEHQRKQLLAEPDMLVYYNRNLSVKEIFIRRWHHGRCFGGMRAAKMSFFNRLVHYVAAPVLPLIILRKIVARCDGDQAKMQLLKESYSSVMLCVVTWSYGETFGNLFGPGDSCERL